MKLNVRSVLTMALVFCTTFFSSGCGGSLAKVNKTKYNQIQEGMSYSQVVKIIGSEGDELASNKIEGIPGLMPSVSTKIYSWANFTGSNMNATFQNDMLVNKAQFGLN